jgi:hypothetical protein
MPSRTALQNADDHLQQIRNLLDRIAIPHLTFAPAAWEMLALDAKEIYERADIIARLLKEK